ncbi:uncharacterized protein LOC135938342 [Cloeon dipterum]|uniref:uncharacterized protein LOC135938342 n=1 Tax=Cloeon dipterum TaxID=197152 RepID=UPI00321FBC7C
MRMQRIELYDDRLADSITKLKVHLQQSFDWLRSGILDTEEPSTSNAKSLLETLNDSFEQLDQIGAPSDFGFAAAAHGPQMQYFVPVSHGQILNQASLESRQNSGVLLVPNCNSKRRIYTRDWKVSFSGEQSSKRSLASFLREVELKRKESNLTDSEFWDTAHHLFEGRAKAWFLMNHKKWHSWVEFEPHLIANFKPPDYDDRLWDQLRSRRQARDERLNLFCSEMETLFSLLSNPPSEREKLEFVRKRLAPYWLQNLPWGEIHSLDDLQGRGLSLESVKHLIDKYRDPQAQEDPVEPEFAYKVSEKADKKDEKGKVSVAELCCVGHTPGEICCAALSYRNASAGARSGVWPAHDNSQRANAHFSARARQQNVGSNVSNGQTLIHAPQGNASQQSNLAVAAKVCWNCFQQGHSFRNCAQPRRGAFCWGCGKDGIVRKNCISCTNSKNLSGVARPVAQSDSKPQNVSQVQGAQTNLGKGTSGN